jgi:hypothetical protein
MRKLPIDLLHASRALLRRRAYFLSASSTLALALGANAAIFAVGDGAQSAHDHGVSAAAPASAR